MKVLIVDDEKPIRQWFTFCIEKANIGWEIAGDAANGKEALEVFKKTLPDLVITDIKMPVMDGIELMKQIKAIAPTTDVVILTCYTDFSYAKEAVKQGAVEYLLKAEVEDEDIFNLLNRIRKKREEEGITRKALEIQDEVLKNALIDDLLNNRFPDAETMNSRLMEYNISIKFGFLFAIAFEPESSGQLQNAFRLLEGFQTGYSNNLTWFKYEPARVLISLGNLKKSPSQAIQMMELRKIGQEIQQTAPGTLGISKVYHSITDIAAACRQAVDLARLSFFKGRGHIFMPEELIHRSDGLPEVKRLQKKMFQEIERKEFGLFFRTVTAIFDQIDEQQVWDQQLIRRFCSQTLEVLYAKIQTDTEIPITDFQRNIIDEIDAQPSFDLLKKWMLSAITDITEVLTGSGEKHSSIIGKAVQFIETHYQEALSLQEVASYVHLNPNYFCQLFKTETGENFSGFLIKIRLREAEKLLITTDLKTYEVAERVGYPNLSYFSRLFKKYKGKSPFEYRSSDLS